MVMGNVSGRKDEDGPSGIKNEEGEEDMEYHAHNPFPESMVQSPPHSPRAYHSPLMVTPQVPINPIQRYDEMMQIQSNANASKNDHMLPTMIMWSYDGEQVGIQGSWDNWKTRELLQKTGKEFTIMKVLPSGVYHYRFIVDGQWRYSPDFPQDHDDLGNIFNVLDLQDFVPECLDTVPGFETPSSPVSSYNNAPFSSEDFNEKHLPELPPILEKSLLEQSSTFRESPTSLEKPSAAVLNHLYIQKGPTGQSLVALSSTHRFRKKYATVVLYKPVKKVQK